MQKQKQIIIVGMNHNTAQVEIREKFSLAPLCKPEEEAFKNSFSDICSELFMLSTCNRVEMMSIVDCEDVNIDLAKQALIERWAKIKNEDAKELECHIFSFTGNEAVKHLFAVASSLDSLVLGEPQILGQIKAAYKECIEAQSVGAISTRLLHKSFSVAKRVRTETALASSAVSISYAAVELAKRIFNTISENSALIIGAGEMAELAALHLKQAGTNTIYVANRTFANAEELAEKVGGIPVSFDELHTYLIKADIIISSTGAQNTILSADDIKPIMKTRENKPMFFIDIAMPRDIEADVNNIDNVYLYDIDDLKEVVEENMEQRRNEAQKAWEIVHTETDEFLHWLQSLHSQPTIVALNQKTESLVRKEIERSMKKLNLSEEDKEEIERMTQSIIKKVNHSPLDYLRKHHDTEKALSSIKAIFDV